MNKASPDTIHQGLSTDFDESVSPWHVLFSFSGRLDRAHYWTYGVMGMLCVTLAGYALLDIAGLSPSQVDGFMLLFLAWPFFALVVKRCHDRNLSGWWSLVALVPMGSLGYLVSVVPIYFLVIELGLRGAHPEANRFGPPLPTPRW